MLLGHRTIEPNSMSDTIPSDDRPEIIQLHDNPGRRYLLRFYVGTTGWTLKAFDRQTLVAMVKCAIQGDGLLMGDLNVFDKARFPQGAFIGWLRSLLGMNPRTTNYQRRGLGTKLLSLVVEKAKEAGMSRITGNLFPRDLAANPNLPNWYQNQGFEVEMDASGNSGRIWRDLSCKPNLTSQ